MLASRAVRFVTFAFSALFAGAAAAASPALVVDVDSGKVLYAERATDPWFPASITKLMTTYVALDMVRSGRASMDQLVTVSPEAAAQPPSKMGFKPGTQLTLDNALKIIMVKSANDIAATIAENLGGSVEGFAAMMNETRGAHRHAREPLGQPARIARRAPADLGARHGHPRTRPPARLPRQQGSVLDQRHQVRPPHHGATTMACSGAMRARTA